jgi:hypothetical protein
VLVPVQLFVWGFRLDKYPVTEWSMYAEPSSRTKAEFYRIRAVQTDGGTIGDLFSRCLPVYKRDARYRDVVWRAFKPAQRTAYEEWLKACVQTYNALPNVRPNRIALVELEHFLWDFRKAPGGPGATDMIESHRREFVP